MRVLGLPNRLSIYPVPSATARRQDPGQNGIEGWICHFHVFNSLEGIRLSRATPQFR